MISFDVVSLFTNVPLIETIDIISDYVYKSKSAFSKLVFKELLNIAPRVFLCTMVAFIAFIEKSIQCAFIPGPN